ncbi:hypothetical protein GCM10010261_65680 [Streptomyces pilosus]|uniref:hypothetical protein n=1 Tax=Streptomyces pilosus TaxID=28893 RepID=UPI001679F153|nr:hypothetical protein [Streptomyces pilosus]GGV70451.1 hypothetical protein GCM10010261_65680 [Streptomyces pilosus]
MTDDLATTIKPTTCTSILIKQHTSSLTGAFRMESIAGNTAYDGSSFPLPVIDTLNKLTTFCDGGGHR